MTTSPLDSSGRDRTSYRNRSPPDPSHITSGRNADGSSMHGRGGQYPYYSSSSESQHRLSNHFNSHYNSSSKFHSDIRQQSSRHVSGSVASSRYGSHSSRPSSAESARSRPYDGDSRNGYTFYSTGSRHDNYHDRSSRVNSRSSRSSRDSFESSREVRRDDSEDRHTYSRRNERSSAMTCQRSNSSRPTSSRPRVITFDHNSERRREPEAAGGRSRCSKSQAGFSDQDNSPPSTTRETAIADTCPRDSSSSPHDYADKTAPLPHASEDHSKSDLVKSSDPVPSPSSSSLSSVLKENVHQNPSTVICHVERVPSVPISPTGERAVAEGGVESLEAAMDPSVQTSRVPRAYLGNRNQRDSRIVHSESAYAENTQSLQGE